MAISIDESESVLRNGESYSIGDKVYSTGRAKFGVGYIKEIEVTGVHFGFCALVDSKILDEPQWYDARCMSHEMPAWADDITTDSLE